MLSQAPARAPCTEIWSPMLLPWAPLATGRPLGSSLAFSFSSTAGMSSLRWARLVNLWPYFSSKGRRASTFANAIPPERKDSTTSKRNSRISAGNVDPHAFSLLSLLCKHAVIVWLSNLLFAISDRPLSCFLDLICF